MKIAINTTCAFVIGLFFSVLVQAEELTTQQLKRDDIDVHAQYSLLRMSKQSGEHSTTAHKIYTAVIQNKLEGVYIVNQQVPALKARRMGTWWGTIIPKDKDAVCMLEPSDEKPLIAFRDSIRSNQNALDAALVSAWNECKLESEPICVQNLEFEQEEELLFVRPLQSPTETNVTLSLWQDHHENSSRDGHWQLMLGAASRIRGALREPERHGNCGNIGPSMYKTGRDIVGFIEETKACGKRIHMLHIFGHSYYQGLIGSAGDMSGLYRSSDPANIGIGGRTVTDIDASAFDDNAVVILHGCRAADVDRNDNFAKALFDRISTTHPHVKVYGHNTKVQVGKEGHTWREYSARSPDGHIVLLRNPYYQGYNRGVPVLPHPQPWPHALP